MSTDRFGPQGVEVAALIRRTSQLTAEEADQLSSAAELNAALVASWYAAWNAARDAGWNAAWWAASNAAADAAAAADAVWTAEADAAVALSVRHLIGQHGYTQDHYDTLTSPWREVIGPVHPDDMETT